MNTILDVPNSPWLRFDPESLGGKGLFCFAGILLNVGIAMIFRFVLMIGREYKIETSI